MSDFLQLFVAHQVPLSMGFSRQEYWSRLLCPPLQGIFPTQGSNTHFLCLPRWRAGSLPPVIPGKHHIYIHIHAFLYSLFFPILMELYSRKEKKKSLPLSDMYTFYPCNMFKMILWLNPGKNVKNAWLDTCFSSKNTALLINCSIWKSLFDMMYIFVLAWD